MNKYRIVSSTFWIISDKIVLFFKGTIISIILARYLGITEYGDYSYIITLVTFVATFAKAGLENIAIKDFATLKDNRINYFCSAICLSSIGIILAIILMVVLQLFIVKVSFVINILIVIFLIFHIFEVCRYYLISVYDIKKLMMLRELIYICIIAIYIIGIIHSKGLLFFICNYLAGECMVLILPYFFAIKYIRNWREKFNLSEMVKSFRHLCAVCIPLIISGLSVSIYMKIDQFMIKAMLDSTQLGIYSSAVKIAEGWYFIPTSLCTSLLPYFSKLYYEDKDKFFINYEKYGCLLNSLAWIIAVVISIFSKLIISILYGQEYIDAANILSLYVWAGIFVCIGCIRSIYISITEYSVYSCIISVVSAIINCIANAILIPAMGIVGATLATIVSQFTQAFLCTFFSGKLRSIYKIQIKSLFGFLFIKDDIKKFIYLLRAKIYNKNYKKNKHIT
jgi:O-antigen/teichoic acid export membrane protein